MSTNLIPRTCCMWFILKQLLFVICTYVCNLIVGLWTYEQLSSSLSQTVHFPLAKLIGTNYSFDMDSRLEGFPTKFRFFSIQDF